MDKVAMYKDEIEKIASVANVIGGVAMGVGGAMVGIPVGMIAGALSGASAGNLTAKVFTRKDPEVIDNLDKARAFGMGSSGLKRYLDDIGVNPYKLTSLESRYDTGGLGDFASTTDLSKLSIRDFEKAVIDNAKYLLEEMEPLSDEYTERHIPKHASAGMTGFGIGAGIGAALGGIPLFSHMAKDSFLRAKRERTDKEYASKSLLDAEQRYNSLKEEISHANFGTNVQKAIFDETSIRSFLLKDLDDADDLSKITDGYFKSKGRDPLDASVEEYLSVADNIYSGDLSYDRGLEWRGGNMDKVAVYKDEIEKIARRKIIKVKDSGDHPLFLDVKKPWYRSGKSVKAVSASVAKSYDQNDYTKSLQSGDAKGFMGRASAGPVEAKLVRGRPRPLLFGKKKFDERVKNPKTHSLLVPKGTPLNKTVSLMAGRRRDG